MKRVQESEIKRESKQKIWPRWIEKIYPYFIFIIFFQLYLKTLCPTVYWEDSSEFITAAHLLGLTHPTGYPLYCVLGKLTTYLCFGSIPFRVNLISAFSSATGIAVICAILVQLGAKLQQGKRYSVFHPGILQHRPYRLNR